MITKKASSDLQAIRSIMEQSSKFLSLSGLAGIFAGCCALVGACVAWFSILNQHSFPYQDFQNGASTTSGLLFYLGLDAILVLVFAVLGTIYFAFRKARKAGQKLWVSSTRRLVLQALIPLVAGGLFILLLLSRNYLDMVIPSMLLFYGLALVIAGKFTVGEIHYLGLTLVILGLLAAWFVHNDLLFWVVGFGAMHILYGTVMYFRHER